MERLILYAQLQSQEHRMSTILNFSKANPIRFVRTHFDGLNYREADNLLFKDWSGKHQNQWFQPFEQGDTIIFQFESSFDNNYIRLIDYQSKKVVIDDDASDFAEFEDGDEVDFEDGTDVEFEGDDGVQTNAIVAETGYDVFEGSYDLSTLPEGIYQFVGHGDMNVGSATYEVKSELIEIRRSWKNSRVIKYYNNEPAFGVDYRSNAVLTFRVLGSFIKPAHENEFDNQTSVLTTVTKIRDFTIERRVLELYEQVPSWYIEKLNLILSHDYVTIDDLQVVGGEKMEYNLEGYADAMGKGVVVIPVKTSNFVNRHDSGTRTLFS